MQQVHSTIMSQTLLKIENLKQKALLISYMKSKFTQKEVAESFQANYELVKKQIELSGVKVDKKFEEMAKKGKNQSFSFVVTMDKAKDSLLQYYSTTGQNQKDQQDRFSKPEMRSTAKKTKKIHKIQKISKWSPVKPIQAENEIFYDGDSEKEEYLMEYE